MKLLKQILCACLLITFSLHAQTADESGKVKKSLYASDNALQSRLDSMIEATVAGFIQNPHNCGISLGITSNNNNYFYNYGETKKSSRNLPGKTTIYEIGSMTNTFCGLLLARAVTEKKISLDDDIRNYLPGKYNNLVFDKKHILVKHLANHSSGLPNIPENLLTAPGFDSLNPYKNYSEQMLLDYLKTEKLASEPGKDCSYSNMGMALLGIILEHVYHQPFEVLVKEKICLEQGMKNTAISLSSEQLQLFADGYNQNGEATPHWELNGFVAAGALRSSTEDLLNYLDYNLQEPDAATRLAHTVTYAGHEHVALAWFVNQTSFGNTLTWHNGATYGSASFGGFIKEKNCSVIILANSSAPVDYIGIAILKYLQQ